MSFLGNFWSRLRGKGPTAPGGPTVGFSMQVNGAPPRRGTRAILEAYRTMPWLHSVSNRLANEAASATKLRLFNGPEDDETRQQLPVTDRRYEVITMLRRSVRLANGMKVSARKRWKLVHLWMSLLGEAGLIKQRGAGNRVVGLVPINPYWVKRLPSPGHPWFDVQVDKDMAIRPVSPDDMIWLSDPDPLNPYARGVGTAESLADELDTDEYAAKMAKAFFVNGGLPDFFVTFEGASEKQLVAAEERFRAKYNGARKSGATHWTGAKMDIKRLDTSFKDQDLMPLRKFERDTIIQTYNVSPEIFGILDGSTRDSTDNAYYLLALGVLVPWLDLLTDALQDDLAEEEYGGGFFFGYKSPVPDDRKHKLQCIATAPSAFYKRDVREVGGFTPDPECGDEPLTSKPVVAGPTNIDQPMGGDGMPQEPPGAKPPEHQNGKHVVLPSFSAINRRT